MEKTTEWIDSMEIPQQQSESVDDCSDHQYPPNDDGIERMILTFTGVVEGISTCYKVCSNCSMMYRLMQ
ncbi:hypothetical protein QQF64_019954 [Cirrhinus molitorella]|uniref:Uncharacterized protein n=1 Tax=Cirrhinus molitorella TaxID=172907 RepID=A0ABR3LH49_9TELE